MKAVLFALLVFATMTSSSFLREPVMKFETLTFDFGAIPQDKPVTKAFKFKNIGDQPVIVNEVRTSCGCVKPSYSKDPVMPGHIGVVELHFNAAAAGKFYRTATVNSNSDKPNILLYITGEVIAQPE